MKLLSISIRVFGLLTLSNMLYAASWEDYVNETQTNGVQTTLQTTSHALIPTQSGRLMTNAAIGLLNQTTQHSNENYSNSNGQVLSAVEKFACNVKLCSSITPAPSACNVYLESIKGKSTAEVQAMIKKCPAAKVYHHAVGEEKSSILDDVGEFIQKLSLGVNGLTGLSDASSNSLNSGNSFMDAFKNLEFYGLDQLSGELALSAYLSDQFNYFTRLNSTAFFNSSTYPSYQSFMYQNQLNTAFRNLQPATGISIIDASNGKVPGYNFFKTFNDSGSNASINFGKYSNWVKYGGGTIGAIGIGFELHDISTSSGDERIIKASGLGGGLAAGAYCAGQTAPGGPWVSIPAGIVCGIGGDGAAEFVTEIVVDEDKREEVIETATSNIVNIEDNAKDMMLEFEYGVMTRSLGGMPSPEVTQFWNLMH